MSDEDWVQVAAADDFLVVEMLLRLSQTVPPPPSPPPPPPPFRLEWTVRQRRSRPVLKKKCDSARGSPTTPLSWSGATSVSGAAADGSEESSRLVKPIDNLRSKVSVTSSTKTPKRSRKKKTLAELKEEESSLLNERRNLKNELAAMLLLVERERATNGVLKRMKLDHVSNRPAESDTDGTYKKDSTHHQVYSPKEEETSFSLPDLNLPLENASDSEVLYGL